MALIRLEEALQYDLVTPMALPLFSLDWKVVDRDPVEKHETYLLYLIPSESFVKFDLTPKLLGLPTAATIAVKLWDNRSAELYRKGPVSTDEHKSGGLLGPIRAMIKLPPVEGSIGSYQGKEIVGLFKCKASSRIPPVLELIHAADARQSIMIYAFKVQQI